MTSNTTIDVTDLKLELAALKRELRIEDGEHQQTVYRINRDIKKTERNLAKLTKKGK